MNDHSLYENYIKAASANGSKPEKKIDESVQLNESKVSDMVQKIAAAIGKAPGKSQDAACQAIEEMVISNKTIVKRLQPWVREMFMDIFEECEYIPMDMEEAGIKLF